MVKSSGTSESSVMASTIQYALEKMANQLKDTRIEIAINATVSIKCGAKPVQRTPTKTKVLVDFAELTHVSMGNNATQGSCIRFVFKDNLYATCGKDADQVIKWAQQVTTTKTSSKVPEFPSVYFEQVLAPVRIHDGELVAA